MINFLHTTWHVYTRNSKNIKAATQRQTKSPYNILSPTVAISRCREEECTNIRDASPNRLSINSLPLLEAKRLPNLDAVIQ